VIFNIPIISPFEAPKTVFTSQPCSAQARSTDWLQRDRLVLSYKVSRYKAFCIKICSSCTLHILPPCASNDYPLLITQCWCGKVRIRFESFSPLTANKALPAVERPRLTGGLLRRRVQPLEWSIYPNSLKDNPSKIVTVDMDKAFSGLTSYMHR
jgi:hypothetical protein